MVGGGGAGVPTRISGAPLHVVAQSVSLNPDGGVELCTYQDTVALAGRGHVVDVLFGTDGVLRAGYTRAGVTLRGPASFDFEPRRPLPDLARFVGPARWVRSRRPDVLWLSRFEHIVWAQAVARRARCPIVCHLHHLPNYQRLRLLAFGVAHFIAVSEFVRDVWVESGLDPARVSVIDNAVPAAEYPWGGLPERSAARRRLGIAPDVPVVLCYGRVVAEKGIGTLLEAWSRVCSGPAAGSGPPLLLVVGAPHPPDDPELTRLFGRVDPATVRTFPNQQDVVPFLHAADVVVFPSWLPEAFGRVVIEGMGTGRPVLASKVGAVPEVLTGPMSRFLVEPRSADALATALAGLLDWRRTEPGLGAECMDYVARHFPFDRHVSEVEEVLQRYRRTR